MNPVPTYHPSFLERLVDSAVGLVSPAAQAERLAYRAFAADIQATLYRGARHSRLDRAPQRSGTPNRDLLLDRQAQIWRARQLEKNSAVAEGLLDRDVDNVIGCGFRHQAKTEDKKWNAKAEGLLEEWGEEEADSRGLDNLAGLTRLFYRGRKRDGDAAFLVHGDGSLRLIESDEICTPPRKVGAPNMIDGVELDPRGRPVAFWIADEGDVSGLNPGHRPDLGRTRIPREDIIFSARRKRAGQTRGVTVFSNSAWLYDALDQHIEAVLAAARMAACLGLVHERKTKLTGLERRNDEDGNSYQQMKLQPGAYFQVGLGESLKQLNPGAPVQNLPELLRLLARLMGLPFGIPLELVFLDFSQGNYAQARGVMLQAWQTWRCEQMEMKRVMRALRNRKIRDFMRTGKLEERPDWKKHTWLTPGWQWIDPTSELDADLLAVDAGFSTVAEVLAKTGKDLEEVVEARAKELELFKKYGLPEARSPKTRETVQPGEQNNPPKKAKEAD